MKLTWLMLTAVAAVATLGAAARAIPPAEAPDDKGPPAPAVKELTGLTVKESAFQTGRPLKAKVIRSEKDAADVFPAEALTALKGQADFAKQFVLVFAWRGSGQDKLTHAGANGAAAFSLEPGRTRDLREHVRAYALPKDARWHIAIPWQEVKALITKGDVAQAGQLHSRKVTVMMKDGTHYESTEPAIDDIIKLIRDSKKDIPIFTE